MSRMFGGGGASSAYVKQAEPEAEAIVPDKNLASKAMEAKPVQTVFGGKQDEQMGSILGGKSTSQMAQLAKKYLLGQ